jgi:hypothetical protein
MTKRKRLSVFGTMVLFVVSLTGVSSPHKRMACVYDCSESRCHSMIACGLLFLSSCRAC